jgi:hypothetical protein
MSLRPGRRGYACPVKLGICHELPLDKENGPTGRKQVPDVVHAEVSRHLVSEPKWLKLIAWIIVRRVKCDEARPSCQRCVSTGRKCDWYTEQIRKPSSIVSSISDTSNAQLINLARSPSTAINGTEKEARSFHFFCQKTAPQLTGFFGDDLWEYLILRASHHEPAIRHAVIALGSLHERFIEHDGMVAKSKTELYRDDFALREYTVAIKFLVWPLMDQKQQSVDVCLIACILFTCFEVPLFC